jgi:NAD(P)-dependent dehydrogenase (short-subunit alcohol dehydrogenase family)
MIETHLHLESVTMSDYLSNLFSLDDRRAVVIGGTGVLGGRIATALAKAGATVVIAGRSEERGVERCAEIQKAGAKATYLPVDVMSRDSIQELHDRAEKEIGPIDILVNGAGVNSAQSYYEIEDEVWQKIFTTNLLSLHWGCQIFSKDMASRGRGSIINIGSASSDKPLSRVFAYSSSKAAVVNYTQNLARELGTTGVRVNSLSPGFFPAEQNRKILDATRVESIMRRTPMARFGEPEDLDGAVILLASDQAGRFITGINLFVDGGFTAMSI